MFCEAEGSAAVMPSRGLTSENPLLFCRSAHCPRKLGVGEEAMGWGSALPAASVHRFWSTSAGIEPVSCGCGVFEHFPPTA